MFEPLLATRRSGTPLPMTSATAVATGPTPAWSRGPGTKVKLLPDLLVDQDGNVVGSLVGDDQVEPAVAGDVGDGDPHRVGAGEEAVTVVERRTERPIPQPGVDQDVVAAAVGDDQVENSVVVEVRQRDRTRG